MLSKTIQAGIAVIALLVAPLAAQAADIPSKAPAYSAPSYFSWTGFYLGLNGGYGFGKSALTDAAGTSTGDYNLKGALAGATLGYNYQTGSWVWGLEGDIDASWIKGSTTVACGGTCETSNSWLGTARGRIGYAWDRWMPYLTGGAAFGSVKITDAFGSGTSTKIGWTAGLGVEYAFWSNWSTKIEYLYADLGKTTCTVPSCGFVDVSGTFKANIVRLGVNYRF
jgi:outer membrane immunogenic protein